MNRIHRARCIRRSRGILAALAGALPASITAEQARRRMTVCQAHPPGGAFPYEPHCGRKRQSKERGLPWLP